jgi:hypothetical protein
MFDNQTRRNTHHSDNRNDHQKAWHSSGKGFHNECDQEDMQHDAGDKRGPKQHEKDAGIGKDLQRKERRE